jgi:hypothetical protein
MHDLKSNPITGLDRPIGFQEVEAPRFLDNRHMKVLSLSALRTGRLYLPGNTPGTHLCWRLSQPQGHSATRRIMSIKNSNDTIGNGTRDLPACSAVPQPTALSVPQCMTLIVFHVCIREISTFWLSSYMCFIGYITAKCFINSLRMFMMNTQTNSAFLLQYFVNSTTKLRNIAAATF